MTFQRRVVDLVIYRLSEPNWYQILTYNGQNDYKKTIIIMTDSFSSVDGLSNVVSSNNAHIVNQL